MQYENKKEIIRQAAVRVISREGYHNTKVQQIADDASISVGTIYNYFESKEEILEYIFEVDFNKKIKCLDELEQSSLSSMERIKEYIRFEFRELMDNPDIMKILIENGILSLRDGDLIRKLFIIVSLRLERLIKQGQKDGEICGLNPTFLTLMIFHSIQGAAHALQISKSVGSNQCEEDDVISFLSNALQGCLQTHSHSNNNPD